MMVDLRDQHEDLERAAIDATGLPIRHVPDDEDRHVDGVTTARIPVAPGRNVFANAREGAPVEVKTCQETKGIQREKPGTWNLHDHQHDALAENHGIYLLAVLDETDVLRWAVVAPFHLDPLLTWSTVATPGVDQIAGLAWPQLFGDVRWDGRGRYGRRINLDGGEQA